MSSKEAASATLLAGPPKDAVVIERAQVQDIDAIHRLLDSRSLPYEDVTEALLQNFLVARLDGMIGVVGLERYQEVALLRSLVVAKKHSGFGLGKQLVAAAEKMAADMQIVSMYLLTTTVDQFFEGLGFRRLPRELAPPSIRTTQQFASLCPASAVVMVKP